MRLSICIATYRRGEFIGETIESVLAQMSPDVELVVVDGASPDHTPDVMNEYLRKHSRVRYYREVVNSGIDRDYDKAVGYARGEFCWLMTDDDILKPGAVSRILRSIDSEVDLLVVNSEVRDANLKVTLKRSHLTVRADRTYGAGDWQQFFVDTGNGLSFIGGTVVRRSVWLSRNRESYCGTLFIHVGVIFQAPLQGVVKVIAEPLILIRYGNAMWTSRGFEIWMFKWPELIWSFTDFSTEARRMVVDAAPWRKIRALVVQRGIGAYGMPEYERFIASRASGAAKWICLGIAMTPGKLLNTGAALYCYLLSRRMGLFDMVRSRHSGWLSRRLGRSLGL